MKRMVSKGNLLKKAFAAFALTSLLFAAGCANSDDDDNDNSNKTSTTQQTSEKTETKTGITLTMSQKSHSFALPDDSSLTLSVKGIKNDMLIWSSSDPFVASVDQNGNVTSLSGGKTTIYAALTAAPSKKASCEVTVEEPNRAATTDIINPKTVSGKIDIITCGDSIMCNYGANDVDQYGLGQALSYFFDSSKATVDNSTSAGGRSSRLFWNQDGRWNKVKELIAASKEKGNTPVVFFSFGHNDERSLDGSDSTSPLASFTFAETNQNGTVAGTLYDYMERYVVTTRELGGIPVLVTPFVRFNMSGSSVSAWARHDLTDKIIKRKDGSEESKGRGNYSLAMKKVAEKHNAVFVDLTSMSAEYVETAFAAGKDRFVYISSDSTHETTLGALRLAEMVTTSLKNDGYFTDYIKTAAPRIMVSKKSLAFGRLFAGGSKKLSFRITNYNVASGKITVSVPNGYGVSFEQDGEYSSSLEIDCADSEYAYGADVWVKFTAADEGTSYNGNLIVSHTSVTPDFGNTPEGTVSGSQLLIALTGAVKAKASGGGTAITVNWPMIDSNNKFLSSATVLPKSDEGESYLDAADVKLVGLAQTSGKVDSNTGKTISRVTKSAQYWPVNDAGAKLDGRTIEGETYDVYLEYAVPVNGFTFFVDKISMEIGSSGTANVYWHIYYSPDGETWTPMVENGHCAVNSDKDHVQLVTSGDDNLGLDIGDGDTLRIRVYPALKTTSKDANARCLMINDVKITGKLE